MKDKYKIYLKKNFVVHVLILLLMFQHSFCRRVVKSKNERDSFVLHRDNEQNIEERRRLSFTDYRRPSSPDSHLVTSLPGLSGLSFNSKHWAGHLDTLGGRIFYWLFEASSSPETAPLVIWLNGGPGCSSMDGLFIENGPFRLDAAGNLVSINQYSWHNGPANTLYVDQPVGTGLSYTYSNKYANNDDEINAMFYKFLENFFDLHTTFVSTDSSGKKTTRPIFFTGESHAGHYIPSMVHHLLNENGKITAENGVVMDVKGMMIGNGWTDPYHQYAGHTFAHAAGLISEGQMATLAAKEKVCQSNLDRKNYNSGICFDLIDDIIAATGTQSSGKAIMYDIRQYKSEPHYFPPGHQAVEVFLNRDDVREAIHASSCPIVYQECTDPPYFHLSQWDGKGVTSELESVLNQNMNTMFFNGQYDIVCNHIGTENVLRLLNWDGSEGWLRQERGIWVSKSATGQSQPMGYIKSHGPLSFLVVLEAGHMVPLNAPEAALDMLSRFIQGRSFYDGHQDEIGVSVPPIPASNSAPSPPGISKSPEITGGPANQQILVYFDPPANNNGAAITGYEVFASPGSLSVSGLSSPISIEASRLDPGIAYVFQVVAKNSYGVSFPSEGTVAVTPGCTEDCYGHGMCAFDLNLVQPRCFEYAGNDGAQVIVSNCTSSNSSTFNHTDCSIHKTGQYYNFYTNPTGQPPFTEVGNFSHHIALDISQCNTPQKCILNIVFFADLDCGPFQVSKENPRHGAFDTLLSSDLSSIAVADGPFSLKSEVSTDPETNTCEVSVDIQASPVHQVAALFTEQWKDVRSAIHKGVVTKSLRVKNIQLLPFRGIWNLNADGSSAMMKLGLVCIIVISIIFVLMFLGIKIRNWKLQKAKYSLVNVSEESQSGNVEMGNVNVVDRDTSGNIQDGSPNLRVRFTESKTDKK